MAHFRFSATALAIDSLRAELADPSCGGYAAFEGWVRNHNEGQAVTRLEYEAFESLAVREGERIVEEARARFGVEHALCVHRVGDLALGELAVWVGVSARHRDEAFRACRYIIDEVKHRVPIWKKEHYVGGDSGWVNCERCATAPQSSEDVALTHSHSHSHSHPHSHHDHPTLVSDYSRQMTLREVGPAGQARLRASTVGVIGAGGLGVPVLQYLAGAGIGRLVIVDGDRLEPSNLHRQSWYALADCGRPKAELAALRAQALNPDVSVQTHAQRLDAHNAAALLADCDVIVDCTDNFSTKFLLNDLAHALRKPVVFASVHQYEGQLQTVDPARGSSCLRCLWPEATRDGVVGNCAEAGVLGPVPGVLGSLQALETLKILLALPDRLRDELLLVDLREMRMSRLRTSRRSECGGTCEASTRALATARDTVQSDAASLQREFTDLDAALQAGFHLIDIREPTEIAAAPLPSAREVRAIPMTELLAGRNLPAEGRYLLICARGARSLTTCRALRERGVIEVYSLSGGAAALRSRVRA
ncbi:MAG: ThiF family adenylyltransferase [Steroidobacteraceae bacterium]